MNAQLLRFSCLRRGHHIDDHTFKRSNSDGRRCRYDYACHCGHSFLKAEAVTGKIRHPTVRVLSGHFIHFLTKREGFAEYVCRNCGHPFCFAEGREGRHSVPNHPEV